MKGWPTSYPTQPAIVPLQTMQSFPDPGSNADLLALGTKGKSLLNLTLTHCRTCYFFGGTACCACDAVALINSHANCTVRCAMSRSMVPPTPPAKASPQRSAAALSQPQTSRSQNGKPPRSCVSAGMKTSSRHCSPNTSPSLRPGNNVQPRAIGNEAAHLQHAELIALLALHRLLRRRSYHGLEPVWRQGVRMEEVLILRDET